jgi:hypothetical protein
MLDVAVIEDPAAVEVSLDPIRSRLLSELAGTVSAPGQQVPRRHKAARPPRHLRRPPEREQTDRDGHERDPG